MIDIVKRLRAPPLAERNEGIKIEAADEIERLRAALQEIVKSDGCHFGSEGTARIFNIARAALGEAKDE
jgi:precorrin-3B methylase